MNVDFCLIYYATLWPEGGGEEEEEEGVLCVYIGKERIYETYT
jgi:hypothetical protein